MSLCCLGSWCAHLVSTLSIQTCCIFFSGYWPFWTFTNNPAIGITFDAKVWEDYSQSPFWMNDQNCTHLHMLSPFSRAHIFSNIGESSSKHLPDTPLNPHQKKKKIICNNWNLGLCTKPCLGNHIHSICSKCNGKHWDKDKKPCFAAIQTWDQYRGCINSKVSGAGIGRF